MIKDPVLEDPVFEEFKQLFFSYLDHNKKNHTSERFAIMKEVFQIEGHFNVETLYNRLKQKKYHVSLTTFYNTLELLQECGLICRHQFGDRSSEFERIYKMPPHDHILVSDSGDMIEFSDPRLDDIISTLEEKYHIRVHHRSMMVYAEKDD